MAVIPEEVRIAGKMAKLKNVSAKRSALQPPNDPLNWLRAIFPGIFNKPFGTMHTELFQWAWNIEVGVASDPFVAIWPRGTGKSTSAEAATIMLGAMGKRKYCLYISATQDLADQHVNSIRDMAESPIMSTYYPLFAKPKLTKEGHSRGWRRNRLVFGNGFTIDSVGLEVAKRGSKMMDVRPDLMILDDCDEKGDGPAITQRKIDAIFTSLLPAGSRDATVLAVQNLIIDTGIFARLSQTNPPFMRTRTLSGPFMALNDFKWWYSDSGQIEISGTPTWEGFSVPELTTVINTIGITAFESEYQHKISYDGSMFAGIRFQRIPYSDVPHLVSVVVSVDPAVTNSQGSDSHGITCMGMDEKGRKYILDFWEKRATAENSLKRALGVAVRYGANLVRIESNQGGDIFLFLWDSIISESGLDEEEIPGIELVRASAGTGSKMERASAMLVDYELGKMFHVEGEFTELLEAALLRFPIRPPDDGVDSCYWSWSFLSESERWLL